MLLPVVALWGMFSLQAAEVPESLQVEIGANGRFVPGDTLVVRVRPPDYGYLAVLQVDVSGRVGLLYPRNPGGDHAVRGRKTYTLLPPTGDQAFVVGGRQGEGVVLAVFSAAPLDMAALSAEGHWDRGWFATLEPGRSPERYLQRVAATLARGARHQVRLTRYQVLAPPASLPPPPRRDPPRGGSAAQSLRCCR